MLIMPPGHHLETKARREVSGRERYFVVFGAIAAIALALVIVFSISQSSPKSKHGCVYVTVSSTTGALTMQGCGAQARKICADVGVPRSYTKDESEAVITECRKAGLPTHPVST